jgi:ubiquinone/menaquinone biosynthesis C-methylase UbiE
MSDNPFLKARKKAESISDDPQQLNRQWWEELPMTYVDWHSDNRELTDSKDFVQLENIFLKINPWLMENFDFTKFSGQKVLEIGCGSGAASCLFAKGGAKVTAIDLTENAVKTTKKNAHTQNLKIQVQIMDAEKTGFESESFDYAFSWGVLQLSHNPSAAFKEISRILKPGKSGLIMVFNKSSLRYYLKGIYWLLVKGKIFKGDSLSSVQRFFTDGYYYKHYIPKELVSELSDIGLTADRISISHMDKKMIPFVSKKFDDYLKKKYGLLLIVEFQKNG